MSKEHRRAAAAWRAAATTKKVKFNKAVDYIKLSAAAEASSDDNVWAPHAVTEILKPNETPDTLLQAFTRRLSKFELGRVKSPGGAQGHSSAATSDNKGGKGKEKGKKGKDKGKGKTDEPSGKGGKAKGNVKGKQGKNCKNGKNWKMGAKALENVTNGR